MPPPAPAAKTTESLQRPGIRDSQGAMVQVKTHMNGMISMPLLVADTPRVALIQTRVVSG